MATELSLPHDHCVETFYAYADYPIFAPVGVASVDRLLTRAALPEGARILDLGCGAGGWIRRALLRYPTATADGVDTSASALAVARAAASADDIGDRVRFHEHDATTFDPDETYDLVLCVGIDRAIGGLQSALDAAGRHLRPGGLVLAGTNFWERQPSQALIDRWPTFREKEDRIDLAGTIEIAAKDGWLPVFGHISTLAENDDYWWTQIGSRNRWAAGNAGHPAATEVRQLAAVSLDEWMLHRGVVGWVNLLLAMADTGSER